LDKTVLQRALNSQSPFYDHVWYNFTYDQDELTNLIFNPIPPSSLLDKSWTLIVHIFVTWCPKKPTIVLVLI